MWCKAKTPFVSVVRPDIPISFNCSSIDQCFTISMYLRFPAKHSIRQLFDYLEIYKKGPLELTLKNCST